MNIIEVLKKENENKSYKASDGSIYKVVKRSHNKYGLYKSGCGFLVEDFYRGDLYMVIHLTFEEYVDWKKVKKGTKIQIRDKKSAKWINRYFIAYFEDCTYPFLVSRYGNYEEFTDTDMDYFATQKCGECRLYKED